MGKGLGKGDKEKCFFVSIMPYTSLLFNVYGKKVPQSTNILAPRSSGWAGILVDDDQVEEGD